MPAPNVDDIINDCQHQDLFDSALRGREPTIPTKCDDNCSFSGTLLLALVYFVAGTVCKSGTHDAT